MEDPTGLGKLAEGVAKLADSEVGIRAYDDLLADAMKEGGKALVDTIKAFRLFTAPIQLLALSQDRLAGFCERVRQRVPEERQVEAPPSVALPVLMNLRYMEAENPLTELYLNLLARAIDKERQDEAHPAFVKIIEQISPDEALLLYLLRGRQQVREGVLFRFGQRGRLEWARVPSQDAGFPFNSATPTAEDMTPNIVRPNRSSMHLRHLGALNLVRFSGAAARLNCYYLTEFGDLFVKACIP